MQDNENFLHGYPTVGSFWTHANKELQEDPNRVFKIKQIQRCRDPNKEEEYEVIFVREAADVLYFSESYPLKYWFDDFVEVENYVPPPAPQKSTFLSSSSYATSTIGNSMFTIGSTIVLVGFALTTGSLFFI